MRLDGASILKAFQDLFPRYGYHIRLDPTAPKTLVVSRFGNASGYRAHAIRNFYEEALENEELVLVERINEEADTENLVNRIFLQGAGEGTAALTLNGSTRTTPYTIEDIVGPDLTSQYYIEDTTSIADYGVIEKYVQFKEIGALSNSSADVRNAANALYDAGVIHLSRYARPFEHYNVILRNVRQNLQVGDTLRLDYVAEIDTPDGKARYFDLEGDYWIMECRESIDANQIITSLRVASVDRMPDTPAKWVQDAIEAVQARDLKPSVTGSIRSYVFPRQIDQHNGGKIPIEFTAASREVAACANADTDTPATRQCPRNGSESSAVQRFGRQRHQRFGWCTSPSDDARLSWYDQGGCIQGGEVAGRAFRTLRVVKIVVTIWTGTNRTNTWRCICFMVI